MKMLALATIACGLLVACVPGGSRPTLGDTVPTTVPAEVDDPAIATLVNRLESSDQSTFTARYRILRKLGAVEETAVVVQLPPERSVEIGDVVLLFGPAADRTCTRSAGTCVSGIDEQPISYLSVTSQFFSFSPATLMRVATSRQNGPPQSSDDTIAGQPVNCIAIPVGEGLERFCVTQLGPVALVDTASVHIELTELSTAADPQAFALGGPTGSAD